MSSIMKFAVVYSEEAEAAMDAEIGAAIKELGADTLLRRDDLHRSKLDVDIIVVIGGDGTLFYSTHYLQEGHIIGLHIGNRHSIGHFFKVREVSQVKDILEKIEAGDNSGFKQFPRLKASIVTGTGREYSLEKAFNDYAVGNSKFGLPSKYFINTGGKEAEFQRSSGIVIPTLQGMTGWAKNIIPERFEKFLEEYRSHSETGHFPYFVREPMDDYNLISGFTSCLEITSDMHHGIVAVDGFRDFPVERGDKIIIEMSSYPIYMYVGSD
jgi:NAD kinase